MAIALVLPLFFGSAGAVDVVVQEDSIPDSLLHPRWKIQRTTPVTYDDMSQGSTDLKRPENIKQEVEYNDSLNRYVLGTRMGKTWLAAPIMMDQQEYLKWTERGLMRDYFREKNSEIYQKKGKEKFDFTDMHFSLGPAEKIFGPGGIRVRTLGTAELKLGATLKSVDNPSLPIRNRNTTSIDFDEKINLNVTGSIGDKMKWNLNYNTDATFDFDAQNMKLRYDGKEDEIIKLVEAGNITFPSNSSLIPGASSLFGIRTDMQFGRLKLQTVFSQKTSSSTSVSTNGGAQTSAFDISAANYEENRHFFLDTYFRNNYDRWMATLPTARTGITINRVEIWVTNKRGQTSNTRDIVAFPALGESTSGTTPPSNSANSLHSSLNGAYSEARTIDQVMQTLEGQTVDGIKMEGGKTYEKIEKARLLTSSEYTLNTTMGYVSLKTQLQSDQVLAIAYEYTSGGVTYQVGEFSADNNDVSKALFVKSLKNTDNTPQQPNWQLMMKNVYYLASSVKKDNFRLDVKYKSDTVGVYTTYLPIPEKDIKEKPLLRLIGADRLDNNNNTRTDGYFDYVEGYTVSNGRVFLPKAEPFGRGLQTELRKYINNEDSISKYTFTELYDNTKTVAKQIAEKNKFKLVGKYKGSNANVISLGSSNVPQGSVTVTAGSQTLKEGTDYTVDYSAGEVTILNQSIIDAGTAINVSSESQSDYGMQRKTLFGLNWEYDFSKNFQISGTLQHLNEQSLTTKVAMGAEPMSNTIVGFNLHWKQESQWLTNLLNKIPLLHLKEPSNIQFNAEFAKLFSSIASGTQDNASYIDDFESATSNISLLTPTSWQLSSVPQQPKETYSKSDLSSGYHRARLAWYTIDPLFTRQSSSLTPSYIKGDLNLLSNHYVREVYINELYPNRDVTSYSGTSSTLSIMNLAYYPDERGPYNFSTDLTAQGKLTQPKLSWGGMMRKLDTNDFEQANIEYVEFWMMDPFVYTRQDGTSQKHAGKLVINLGEVSEDVLLDGKKFYESGMPVTDAEAGNVTTTQWGKVPVQNTITYAFATSEGARAKQDVGFNGLNDEEEQQWPQYQNFLNYVKANVTSAEARDSILNDPAGDDYHYFRGSDWDERRTGILDRYKYINNPQGNSPDSNSRTEDYDTSYKTTPDVEDINQDYTLNEYEKYYEYTVAINPDSMQVGSNYIVDQRTVSPTLRNGTQEEVRWYQFRVPIRRGKSVGGMSDISSIRFMRVYMTDFEEPTVLRLASLDLVRGDWRIYDQTISDASANPTATFNASSISIEENSDKKPVNYILPPGISRVTDPTQPQLTENNEEAMRIDVSNMAANDAVAVYKNTNYDMRHYNQLQMFVHANTTQTNTTQLANNELALFVRLGSDYNTNYYEYLIPLKLTPEGQYDMNSTTDKRIVWPEENMLNLTLSKLTALKKQRNKMRAQGQASYSTVYTLNDSDNPKNKLSIMGNPTLGEVRTIMIGVKNISNATKDGEVWVNELRLLEPASEGGWAAAADINVQLSDLGSVSASGKYVSDGFGSLEQKVLERSTDKYGTYSVTTNLELGKFFPAKAKVSAPFYYSVTKSKTSPKYNPLDTDMLLDDALESAATKQEKDSIESIAIVNTVNRNLSLSNVNFGIATKKHPMPYDPANFTFSYSHSHQHTDGETTVFENTDNWRGAVNYAWSPVYKPLSPFKKSIKSKSKYFDILKNIDLNWLPQSISAGTEMTRYAHELQERDLGTENSTQLPVNYDSQFRWNREFAIRWDLTKNLRLNFQSATQAEIEENWPKDRALYASDYEAYKDSLNSWQSIKHMGKPLDYNQTFTGSYKLPLNLIPVLNWLNADASYNATYHWARGTTEEDGSTLGNTITNNRTYNLNGKLDMVKLYNQVPFLKKVNELFSKRQTYTPKKKTVAAKDTVKNKKDTPSFADRAKKNAFVREMTLAPDTAITVTHGKKTKRLNITARTEDGKLIPLKIKKLDENKIRIVNKGDSTMKVKLQVVALEPLDDKPWYKVAQHAARFAMMVRNISVSYRNQYAMTLPGFMPNVGDIFGQRTGGQTMAPGLAFAFGLTGDDFINKAQANNWLLNNDSIATPATSTSVKDLQVKMTLEPIRDLKIDLNMTHSETKAKSIQYMYAGTPTTQSGSFTMTTISLGSAFEGIGSADNGYHSATFEKFCNSLAGYQARLQARYEGAVYPAGTTYAGAKYDAAKTPVNQYSADVMVPAFLNAYTGYSGTDIFPTIASMLPNWTIKYSGLTKLPWIRDHFKSVNINHSYKSIYAVGSYSSYSTYKEFMGEGLGFTTNATTGDPTPSSMFNVSTVSINEAFSPLLGIDVTLQNNMTFKAEYRTTRVLSLSITSIQLNETTSKDWVFGFGYKINDFQFWRGRGLVARSNKSTKQGNGTNNNNNNNKTTTNSKTTKKGFAHDLNLRLDLSYRQQAAITRDIATVMSSATSGNTAFKLAFSAEYAISRLLSMSFYYDRQSNTPLLSSSSYPTVTQDFGLSMKFSLTR